MVREFFKMQHLTSGATFGIPTRFVDLAQVLLVARLTVERL